MIEFGQGDHAHVAIITGAARGLGRSWAIALAARGARIVVNDNDLDHSLVDKVVCEIKDKGGIAVADYHSVTEGKKVVNTAMKYFKRVDILINNATLTRDGSFRKMTEESWDEVYKASLLGSFSMSSAVWPIMRAQKYGRIINCASAAGFYGNFGQVNYATMKMGLVGFTVALNREGVKYNIHVNCVSAVAGTRLTEPVMPSDVWSALKPELTAPIMVYLCHPTCGENGSLFELGGGWVGKLRIQRTYGVGFPTNMTEFTPELVAEQWKDIVDYSRVTHPTTTQESFQPMLKNLESPELSLVTPRSQECHAVFDKLATTLKHEGAAISKQITGVMQWHVNNQVWTISILKGEANVVSGNDNRFTPDLHIYMNERDFLQFVSGELKLLTALGTKRIRLSGNMRLAMKLQPFADLMQQKRMSKL